MGEFPQWLGNSHEPIRRAVARLETSADQADGPGSCGRRLIVRFGIAVRSDRWPHSTSPQRPSAVQVTFEAPGGEPPSSVPRP